MKTTLHTFAKYLFDLILTVLWIWVPMYHFNLAQSEYAIPIWMADLATLGVVLYMLHRKGDHSL